MRGPFVGQVKRRARTALWLILFVSGCGNSESVCLTDFCTTKTEAIRQVDWIAVRLLERHPDGVAPASLEDALGMRLLDVLPEGGTLRQSPGGSKSSFNLTLPNGRELLFEYSNESQLDVGKNALNLGIYRFQESLGSCSWSNTNTTWACLRR
jgi:hypothetical protein